MSFNIGFPSNNLPLRSGTLRAGEVLFVLGANGVGKSSLMHKFQNQNLANVRKISAHRQTWMSSDTLDMTPAHKVQMDQHLMNDDTQGHSRYKDPYGAQRASMTIYELIDAENVRARGIAAEVDAGRMEDAKKAAKFESPVRVINELLQLSNIPIEITIHENERIMARKNGGPPYSAAELSDGERNALLIAGSVLTAPKNRLVIIDEPERHLHRAIISPLLTELFRHRRDCAFIVSTHDHDLPLENAEARTLLIRSCSFAGDHVVSWDADELAPNMSLDDTLKRDLVGARRKIIFVEGDDKSLDKPLYSLIFPQVSIISKGSCREVEAAVQGVAAGQKFHWLRAFGIVDGDGGDIELVENRAERGIYSVPFYSVEAIYFHPKVIEMVARAQSSVSGDDPDKMVRSALEAAMGAVRARSEKLCEVLVKRDVSREVSKQLPKGENYLDGVNAHIFVDSKAIMARRKRQLDSALDDGDWEAVLSLCSIRQCGARDAISKTLNFRFISDYEKAVLNLLSKDREAIDLVRGFFGDLCGEILS